jgi:hypothetical protein
MLRRHPRQTGALAATPLLRDLSKREYATVQKLGTLVDLRPGLVLGRTRPHHRQFAIVVSGELAATSTRGLHRTLSNGDWFGTVNDRWAAATETEAFETVIATRLFVISSREFTALQSSCPRFAARLCSVLDAARTARKDEEVAAMTADGERRDTGCTVPA